MSSDHIILGKFGRPHGVRGEVRFWPYNPDTELIQEGAQLVVDDEIVTIESMKQGDRFVILQLDGVQGREEADLLKNKEAWVPRDALPELDDDEFYLADVIGFDVVGRESAADEPTVIGKLDGFMDSTTVEVMIITGPRIKRRALVPMHDAALERIDHESGIVYLHPFDTWMPEGERVLETDS